MRRLSWYWMMKYSWLCWSLRRSFSVSWVSRRSSSKAWLICWYFWDMLSIIPPTGELDCQLQSTVDRGREEMAGLGTVIGMVGFPLDGAQPFLSLDCLWQLLRETASHWWVESWATRDSCGSWSRDLKSRWTWCIDPCVAVGLFYLTSLTGTLQIDKKEMHSLIILRQTACSLKWEHYGA